MSTVLRTVPVATSSTRWLYCAVSGCVVGGTTFAEGSRVPSTADPCAVQVCVEGEVLTTKLQCFTRDDCQGRTEPGQCCPSYNHCTSLGQCGQLSQQLRCTSSLASLTAFSWGRERVRTRVMVKRIKPFNHMVKRKVIAYFACIILGFTAYNLRP